MSANKKHFCVIGAGASGLTAIKSCIESGAEVTCFERTDDIGGLWRYSDEISSKGCVAKSTVINTSKEFMAFSDFPIPSEFPNFMRHEMIMEYFKLYANHFGLRKYIRFLTDVRYVDYNDDTAKTSRWKITYRENNGSDVTEVFDGVFVCTGHHAEPHIPKFPGLDEFKGVVMHTHDYKKGDGFVDKNVLVVGIGNSGGDVAVELCRFAKTLHISTRRGTWCYPRSLPNGMPLDSQLNRIMSTLMQYAPRSVVDYVTEKLVIEKDHNLLGIRPHFGPSQAHLMINDDFPNRLLSGLIKLKPDIKCFGPNSVTFVDGTEINDLDAVILATGYVFGFPFLPAAIVPVKENKVNLYKLVFPPDLDFQTLAIIGCIQPVGAIMPISEIQCRWVCQVFLGQKKLPPREKQWEEIEERRRVMNERYVASQRHTIQVDFIPYMDELADEAGCKPSLAWMIMTGDFKLAYYYIFQQVVPYQYRLYGPHSWKGARDAVLTVYDRIKKPLTSHISEVNDASLNAKKDQ